MKFTNLFLITFYLLTSVACSTKGLKPRDVEEYYVSTGVEKYFLPDLPEWANFSQSGSCFRNKSLRYLNIDSLMKSYSLSFFEAIQLQGVFNEDYIKTKQIQGKTSLTLKEDETLFFKASEQIGSKIFFTDLPSFNRIHLIWLDEVVADKGRLEKLKTFLTSDVHDMGFPVIISACLTRQEVETLLPEANYKMISAELFSIYDSKGVKRPVIHVNLSNFFKPDQKIYLYGQTLKTPLQDIQGNYKILNY